jgi:hypothetical protein
MSVGGILTNCALMGVTSETVRHNTHAIGLKGLAIVLFAYEQLLLFFK